MGQRRWGNGRLPRVALYAALVLTSTRVMAAPEKEGSAQGGGDLAQQLQNPVAELISLPIQSNIIMGLGPADGNQLRVNIQPVIPLKVAPWLNIITRTIMPIVSNPASEPGGERVTGIGDTVFSLFFSPAKAKGLIWGVGPVMQLPTATKTLLGESQYGLGPTGVALLVFGGWTTGVLANHIWSVTGLDGAPTVNRTFFQPFVSYTLASGLTLGASSETVYDWEADSGERWTVPVLLSVSKLITVGKLPLNVAMGGLYFPKSPTAGPDWGLRLQVVFVLPTGKKE